MRWFPPPRCPPRKTRGRLVFRPSRRSREGEAGRVKRSLGLAPKATCCRHIHGCKVSSFQLSIYNFTFSMFCGYRHESIPSTTAFVERVAVSKLLTSFATGKHCRTAFQAVGVREWLDCRSERDACNEKGELDARGSSLESWPTMTTETLDEFRYGDTLSLGLPSRWRVSVVRRLQCKMVRSTLTVSAWESWPRMTAETLGEFRYENFATGKISLRGRAGGGPRRAREAELRPSSRAPQALPDALRPAVISQRPDNMRHGRLSSSTRLRPR